MSGGAGLAPRAGGKLTVTAEDPVQLGLNNTQDPYWVLNAGGGRAWIGSDSDTAVVGRGVPLEGGAALRWRPAGLIWASNDPGDPGDAELYLTRDVLDFAPASAGVSARVNTAGAAADEWRADNIAMTAGHDSILNQTVPGTRLTGQVWAYFAVLGGTAGKFLLKTPGSLSITIDAILADSAAMYDPTGANIALALATMLALPNVPYEIAYRPTADATDSPRVLFIPCNV